MTNEELPQDNTHINLSHTVTEQQVGMRLDKISAIAFDEFSQIPCKSR